jgi:DNA mismatch endonuclease, patch repair protein
MADNLTGAQRRKTMAAVKSRNTTPELAVRSLVHRLGFRFRLHGVDLPGSPDLVLPKHRAVIFVHGCFWHGHSCRRKRPKPQTNVEYWQAKIERNCRRDRRVRRRLRSAGWRVLVVWECQATRDDLADRLTEFLDDAATVPPARKRGPAHRSRRNAGRAARV